MKTFNKICCLLTAVVFVVSACSKKDYSLGTLPDKSELKFEVKQDLQKDPGGNTVILVNNTPETVPVWDYGTGKSYRQRDTIKFAFKGKYTVKFSAVTEAGIVTGDSVVINVTQDNLQYVSDPLWIALTGGPGKEKTWVLDYGEHGIFDGPLSYYEPQTTWTEIHNGTAKLGWAPAWKDNQWIIGAQDSLSTMTFSLIGGPYFRNHKVLEGKDETGTYYLDVNTKTLTTNNATILRSKDFIANAANWTSNLVVLDLTENSLRVGVRRTNSEGDYLYVWNFISKEYKDHYVPPATPTTVVADEGFNPKFAAGELLDYLTAASSRVWKLDAEGNPIDWIAKGKGWTTGASSSADWGWNAGWTQAVADSYIKFEKNGLKYTRFQNGVKTIGTFSINESKNEITLSGGTLLQNVASWMNPTQTTLKVVKAFPTDVAGKGIWFGTSYDASKDEWLSFHYVLF